MSSTYIISAGTSKFSRPGVGSYHETVKEAVTHCLESVQLGYDKVEAAVCSYNYGAPTCGQSALRNAFGATGIPIFNSNNNCCAGSSAVYLGRTLIMSQKFDCVLVCGFEEMGSGLSVPFPEMISPVADQFDRLQSLLDSKDTQKLKSRSSVSHLKVEVDEKDTKSKKLIVPPSSPALDIAVDAEKRLSDEETRTLAKAKADAFMAKKYTMDTVKLFAKVADERKYPKQLLAEIAAKNRWQGRATKYAMLYKEEDANCPNNCAESVLRDSASRIAAAPTLFGTTTVAMAGPTGNGAAAILLCSERFLQKRILSQVGSVSCVEILSQALVSDQKSSFTDSELAAGFRPANECIQEQNETSRSLDQSFGATPYSSLAGFDCAKQAVAELFREANRSRQVNKDPYHHVSAFSRLLSNFRSEAPLSIRDVSLIELHDCFAVNEAMLYEALGLTAEYEGNILNFWSDKSLGPDGFFRFGKQKNLVINVSGGLISKGHPIGATGIAQIAEIFWQLTEKSDHMWGKNRQMHFPNFDATPQQSDSEELRKRLHRNYAISHNYGFNGGACMGLYASCTKNVLSGKAKL